MRQRIGSRGGGGLILLYHRVATGFDPLELNVSPTHFADHLEILIRHAEPCSLHALVAGVRDHHVGRRLVTVTFDDGYQDNLNVASPMLERAGVSGTVFVTPYAQRGVREMWWDELARLAVPSAAANADTAWTLDRSDDPTPEHTAFRNLFRALRQSSPERRQDLLADLRVRAGYDEGSLPLHPLLELDEISRLDASPAIEVGGHTMTHPVLAELSSHQQFAEISGGRSTLSEILGRPPMAFAYPFGTPADYNRQSVRVVARAGYDLGCANFAARVGRGSPKLELPRVLVRDWTGEEFERRLVGMLGGRM